MPLTVPLFPFYFLSSRENSRLNSTPFQAQYDLDDFIASLTGIVSQAAEIINKSIELHKKTSFLNIITSFPLVEKSYSEYLHNCTLIEMDREFENDTDSLEYAFDDYDDDYEFSDDDFIDPY